MNRGTDNRVALTSRKSVGRLIIVTGLGTVLFACSSSNPGSTAAVGGEGAGTSMGGGAGTKSTGGSGAQVGGTASTGGSSTAGSQGGNTAQTGSSTGGASTTSSATGGAATGGTPANTGGAATGGAATGGGPSLGTGGSATGGAATGGAATGGQTSVGTGGAATGGAGSGGSSACAAATIAMVSSSDYQIKLCDVTLDINPQVGARVSKLALTPTGSTIATNIIQPYTCASYDPNSTCNNSGSTFWTSPQSGWDGTVGGSNVWPPVAAIDGNAYTAAVTANHLVLTGSADTTLGASVTKDFSADSATGWFNITYTIKATKSIQVAPWQITRVPRGGLVLFPLVSLVSNATSPQWVLSPSGGYEWLDDSTQTTITSGGPKVIADGGVSGQNYTWLAYALGGNLLLIKYPDVQASAFAPSEGDTEVYPGSGYIELESQGAYGTVAASGTMPWTVQWRVVAIPSTVTVAAGSTTLATFAQLQAAM